MKTEQELVELQETIYTSRNPTRRWLHCSRRDWIISTLKKYANKECPDSRKSLEIGPGSGIYIPELIALSTQTYVSDIEEAYLKHVRQFKKEFSTLNLEVDDITDSKLEPGTFDLILCTEVIEHIADSKTAVANMHRLLKPGGLLVLSTPQRFSPLELFAKIAFLPGIIQLVRYIYKEPILETGHINLMTEGQVTDQIKAAGFTIIESHKSGMYIPLIAELMGERGLQIERYIEKKIYNGKFDWLLWTQYYIARA